MVTEAVQGRLCGLWRRVGMGAFLRGDPNGAGMLHDRVGSNHSIVVGGEGIRSGGLSVCAGDAGLVSVNAVEGFAMEGV